MSYKAVKTLKFKVVARKISKILAEKHKYCMQFYLKSEMNLWKMIILNTN